MKIIRFIVGTIISIVALAIATKIAALILGTLAFVVALLFFLLKLALIGGIVALIIWGVSRLFAQNRESQSL